jgi:formylmethanofuran dehydrogenase subunit E
MHEHASARKAVEQMIKSGDLEGLLRQAEVIHGHRCPMLALGVKAGQYAMIHLALESTGMEEVVAIVEANNCFTDGIQVVTGCTLGNGGLIFKDLGKTAVTVARRQGGAAVRLVVRPDFREQMFAKYPAVEPLFDLVVVKGQGSPGDRHRFQHLWEAIARRELEAPLKEQFLIKNVTVQVPESSRMFASVTCSRCGEGVMEPRVQLVEGAPTCLVCAGKEYQMLTGHGIGLAREPS